MVTSNYIKAVLTYKFAQNISLPNSLSNKQYEIYVLSSDDDLFNDFNNVFKNTYVHKIPIRLTRVQSVREIQYPHILFVDNENNSRIKDIVKKLSGTPTLIVTDHIEQANKSLVMINLYSENDKIKFEINNANISNAGITIDPKLLLIGGTELDVVKLYKETQQDLDNEKYVVKNQQMLLDKMKDEIENKKSEIEKQKQEILFHKSELEKQRKEIDAQKSTLNTLTDEVIKKQQQLELKTKELDIQLSKIKNQESDIIKQEMEINEKSLILQEQRISIQEQDKRISEQKNVLLEQSYKIKSQKNILLVVIIVAILISTLAFFIWRSYELKNSAGKILEQKNLEIKKTADQLAREKEITTSSITYAKTLQDAYLPQLDDIRFHFDVFALFKPKDIVSGDFYWFYKTESTKGEETFFIVLADCTGHGVPGAMMSFIGISLLNEIVKHKNILDPAQILEEMDKGVRHSLKQSAIDNTDGMDVCLCKLVRKNKKEFELTFSGSKRFLLVKRKISENLEQWFGDRKSIGGGVYRVSTVEFKNHSCILNEGDWIYLTSDGIFDQNGPNPKREKFGFQRLESVLLQYSNENADVQMSAIDSALKDHMAGVSQRDDITVIGLKI